MTLAGSLANSLERKFRLVADSGGALRLTGAIYGTMASDMSQLKQLHDSGAGYAH